MTAEERRDLQSRRWQAVVPHLFSTPFYQRKLRQAGITAKDLTDLSSLARAPFTTKHDLRQTTPLERTPFGLRDLEYFFASSGTSGPATSYFWTRSDTAVLREAGARAMWRVGVQDDDVVLVLARLGLPIMWYCMLNQFTAGGAGVVPLGVRPPAEMMEALFNFPISILISLPVVGTRLFEFMVAQGRRSPETRRLRQFQSGGDFLSDARRRRIEQCWGANCFDMFGMSEIFGPIAGECSEKSGMHLLWDYVYVEILHPESREPMPNGEAGIAVYTTLWPKGSPVLRYWSDDVVQIDTRPCACGRTSPRMRYVGRLRDSVQLGDRRVFARDLEETVLGLAGTGNEYWLELSGHYPHSKALLTVEEVPGQRLPADTLRDALVESLGVPATVTRVPSGSLPRDDPKPRRIVDRREPRR